MLVKMIFDHWAIFEKGHYHLIRWDGTWSSFSLVPQMLQVLHSMHCRQWKCQCYQCLMLMRRKYLPRIMMHWRYHVPEYSTNNSFTLKSRKWSKMTKKYFLGKVLKLAKWTWWSEGKLGDRIVRTPSSLKTTLGTWVGAIFNRSHIFHSHWLLNSSRAATNLIFQKGGKPNICLVFFLVFLSVILVTFSGK